MSEPASAPLPEPHQQHLEQLLSLVTSVGGQGTNAAVEKEPGVSRHRVMTVSGGRGSGKTTILLRACRQLKSDGRHLILPVIQPEFFSPSDSVLGLCLATLRATLEADAPEILTSQLDGADVTVSTQLQRLLRRASLIGARDSGDESASLQPLQAAAEDFAASAAIGSTFLADWKVLTQRVLSLWTATRGAGGLLIVPVDDADLAPELLPRVLIDLRLMTLAQQTVVLACLDLSEARRALGENYLRAFPRLASSEPGQWLNQGSYVHAAVESHLTKAIPPQWRIAIRELTLSERLGFNPLGADENRSIANLLTGFALPEGSVPARSLGDLFWDADGDYISRYAECLPSNPRNLEALHYRLEALAGTADGTRGAVEAIAEQGVADGLGQLSAATRGPEGFVSFSSIGDARVARVLIDQLRFYGLAGGEEIDLPVHDLPPGSSVSAGLNPHTLVGYGSRDVRPDSLPRVPNSLYLSLLLVRDAADNYGLFREDLSGAKPIRGGRASGQPLRMRLGKSATDDQFLVQPAWEGWLDYFLSDEGWRAILAVARRARGVPHRDVVAGLTLEWWRLHAEVQRRRRVPRSPGRSLGAILEVPPQQRAAAARKEFETTWGEVDSVYAEELQKRDTTRASDFVDWVEGYVLFACHPELQHEWFVDATRKARTDTLRKQGREAEGDSNAALTLAARIRRSVEEQWVSPLIDLLSEFDPDEAAELRRLHEQARSLRDEGRRRRLASHTMLGSQRPGAGASATAFQTAMRALGDLEAEADSWSGND